MTEQDAMILREKMGKAMTRIFHERGYDFVVVPEEGDGMMGLSIQADGEIEPKLFKEVMVEAANSIGAGDFLPEIHCGVETYDDEDE